MRIDPFTDTWLFIAGQWGDETKLGIWRWFFVVLFVVLIAASVVIAAREWRVDATRRTGRDVAHWIVRVLVGGMWFVNTLWKLPLFDENNGLHYWIDQETSSAAFGWLRDLAANVFLQPAVFDVLDLATFLLELGFAVSLVLGVGVRAAGTIGVVFVAQLWLGLYRQENEWPWTYVFLMMLMGLFALHAAGRSLGLDGALRRWAAGRSGTGAALARLVS